MKGFILFLVIVLAIYGSVNTYLFVRILQAAQLQGWALWGLRILLILLILAYPASRILAARGYFTGPLVLTGSFWLGAMGYGLLIVILLDLVRLSDRLFRWLPPAFHTLETTRLMLFASASLVVMLLVVGYVLARRPVTVRLDIPLAGYPADKPPLRAVMISDIHLGEIVSPDWFEEIVDRVMREAPDVIFINGDLVDEPPHRLTAHEPLLDRLNAPYGVWAVIGNHEVYNGLDASIALMERHNIRVLRDQHASIDNRIRLVGVDDRPSARQIQRDLPPFDVVFWDVPKDLPIVLLHHTPALMKEAAAQGVQLQLSGHTHNGQAWPAGYLAKMSYGVSTGWKQISDSMRVFVSNGVGSWGPPIRIGAPPQVVVLTFHGEEV